MEEKKVSVGSIVGTIIIIVLIILGGLYFWGKRIEEAKKNQQSFTPQENTQKLSEVDQETALIKNTSSSDELAAIETDIQNTNLENLDAELKTN